MSGKTTTILERLDALAAKLDARSIVLDDIKRDVDMIKELVGVE